MSGNQGDAVVEGDPRKKRGRPKKDRDEERMAPAGGRGRGRARGRGRGRGRWGNGSRKQNDGEEIENSTPDEPDDGYDEGEHVEDEDEVMTQVQFKTSIVYPPHRPLTLAEIRLKRIALQTEFLLNGGTEQLSTDDLRNGRELLSIALEGVADQVNKTVQDFQSDLAKEREELDEATGKLDETNRSLDARKAELANTEAELNEKKKAYESLEKEVVDMKATREQLSEEVSRLRGDKERITQEIQTAKQAAKQTAAAD